MTFSVQPIKLFGTFPDDEAALISHGGRLVAVALHLSHLHGEHEGRWFVEWGSQPEFADGKIFASLDAATDWLSGLI